MSSAHLRPVILRNGKQIHRPDRRLLGDGKDAGKERENEIQQLIHEHPDVMPMAEIEGSYEGMVSICTELQLDAGYLDNLWMTPFGGIVLGECKLFRNPQARREVIAQALDYARSLQGMPYEEFERRIAEARKEPGFNLWTFATGGSIAPAVAASLAEADFIDGVSRRLRDGRFMVLVIGDGIHEGLEDLTKFLQLHAGIHANLALVDLSLWRIADGETLVIPRLPMKTATIVRGIVEMEGGTTNNIRVSSPPTTASFSGLAKASRPHGASEVEFFTELTECDPASAGVVRELCDTLHVITGQQPRFSSEFIHFDLIPKKSIFNVRINGEIHDGSVLTNRIDSKSYEPILKLLRDLASLMNATIKVTPAHYNYFVKPSGGKARASTLAGHVPEVIDIVRRMIEAASSSED